MDQYRAPRNRTSSLHFVGVNARPIDKTEPFTDAAALIFDSVAHCFVRVTHVDDGQTCGLRLMDRDIGRDRCFLFDVPFQWGEAMTDVRWWLLRNDPPPSVCAELIEGLAHRRLLAFPAQQFTVPIIERPLISTKNILIPVDASDNAAVAEVRRDLAKVISSARNFAERDYLKDPSSDGARRIFAYFSRLTYNLNPTTEARGYIDIVRDIERAHTN